MPTFVEIQVHYFPDHMARGVGVSFKMRKRRETGKIHAKRGSEGGRRGFIGHTHIRPCMAIPGKPSARLTHYLRLITGQRLLRFSILKETPTPRQNGKIVFGQQLKKIIVEHKIPIKEVLPFNRESFMRIRIHVDLERGATVRTDLPETVPWLGGRALVQELLPRLSLISAATTTG
jgi:hypothetical protein